MQPLVFIIKRNFVGVGVIVTAVMLSCSRKHDSSRGPLSEDITSSTKPEVCNVSKRRPERTELLAQSTCIEFGEVRTCGSWDTCV